jgi:hypothetical protein
VKLVYQHDNLEILEPQYLHNENNPVIRIPAKGLVQLEVNGNGLVCSETILNNAKPDVFINGLCYIKLSSNGKIKVHASPNYELKYSKNKIVKFSNNI